MSYAGLSLPISDDEPVDGVDHGLGSGQHVPIGEAKNLESEARETVLTFSVTLKRRAIGVEPGSIQLDQKSTRATKPPDESQIVC